MTIHSLDVLFLVLTVTSWPTYRLLRGQVRWSDISISLKNFHSLLWKLTSVFLPAKSHGQRSLVGYSSWDCKELDTTDGLTHTQGVPIRAYMRRGLARPFPLRLCSCARQDSLKADQATADRLTQPKCGHRGNSPAKQLPKSSSVKSFRGKLFRVHEKQ